MKPLLIVFAGNTGKNTNTTRHNIGRMIVPYLEFANAVWKEKFKGHYSEGSRSEKTLSIC